jgi:hypothetical protein
MSKFIGFILNYLSPARKDFQDRRPDRSGQAAAQHVLSLSHGLVRDLSHEGSPVYRTRKRRGMP